jgi:acetyl-CoA C-acetyltransferase
MGEPVIVSTARTAIGTFGGAFKGTPLVHMGAHVIREVLNRAGLRPKVSARILDVAPQALKDRDLTDLEKTHVQQNDSLAPIHVDEVIMGHVLQGGHGQNTARQAMIYAGVPKETNAFTINKVCASGMKAVALAAQAIAGGDAEVVIAGGMENMSMSPYGLPAARWGARMFNSEMLDLMVHDGLWEIFYGYHMGVTAENIAELYGISRNEQDELGLMSHQRARNAIKEGKFAEEIIPFPIPQRKGDPIVFDTDERPMDTSLEKMSRLPTVFKKDGTVTAGNASGINDAAAAILLMSAERAKDLHLEPAARIRATASGAIDPAFMGLGPIPATKKALQKAGVTLKDIDLVELNEAFASQALACVRELNLDMDKTNLNGSGISLGHPIGCTGARIIVSLIHEMRRRQANLGLATLCIGGGQGMAMVLEAL